MKKGFRIYRTKEGREPFVDWMTSLRDNVGRARITNRLNRVLLENYGDCRFVGSGVYELKIHYGPGYRVYFCQQEETILLLLVGGSKRTQRKDIQKAKEYWVEFRERIYD